MAKDTELIESFTPKRIPKYLYHFTTPTNVRSILRSGLRPSRDVLGNDPAIWLNAEAHFVMGRITFRVSTVGLNKSKFESFGDGEVYLYKDHIPAKNVEVVAEELTGGTDI